MLFELEYIFICPKMFRCLRIIYCWHVLKAFKLLLIRFYQKVYQSNLILLHFIWSFDMHQSHHLFGFYAMGINFLLIHFLNTFRCSSLLRQSWRSTWIKVWNSTLLKLRWGSINIKIYTKNVQFTIRKCDITIIVMKNRTLPSQNKLLWGVLIIFHREQILVLIENHQWFYHKFFPSYIYQYNILASFKTHTY